MELYYDLIENKYKLSNKFYQKKFTDEANHEFLFYFDVMNVYPLFPTILDFTFHSDDYINNNNNNNNNKKNNIVDLININTNKTQKVNKKINELVDILENKFKEVEFPQDELKKHIGKTMVRRLFSWEIKDEITSHYNGEYVSMAWLKCYELLSFYDLINNSKYNSSDKVKYFGICEQPGAFIYAINHYVKTKLNKDFDFVIQSLNVPYDKNVFKPEKNLYQKYKDNYNYGVDGTGDITSLRNTSYYRKKYFDIHFDIITGDCGQNVEKDFVNQENKLFLLVFSQVMLGVSLADKGSDFIFKLFTMYNEHTQELIFLLSNLFEKVHIARTLTTKPQSGELYCICKNFKYTKNDMNDLISKLKEYRRKYDENNKTFLFDKLDENFYKLINETNEILTYRRITSINFLYFRVKNNLFVNQEDRKEIKKYIDDLTKHYMNYYVKLYKITPLKDKDKLVSHKFETKWASNK